MDETTRRTFTVLEESPKPLSTNEVADRLDVDWHTAKKRLELLREEGKVYRKAWQRNLTLWWDREIPV
ncbi:MAG: hypothetical protein SVU32_02380 [Candidatus Nanohaloarchaea archaeon]|nr:hypothetical protein [Candidatus Nanohaloarchaea archaeon]